MRLHLFGAPARESAAGREPFAAARPCQLLAYLACRGTWVTRDVAATLLWPDRDSSTARANLRFVLVQIRRLSYVEGLEARTDSLRWQVDSDVKRFEQAVAAGNWAGAIDACEGPLLQGFELGAPAPFVEWLQFERARLSELWRGALAARLAQLVHDPAGSVALATRAMQADPIDETALTFLLQALRSLGRDEEARRAYRTYAERLATELAIEPSAALRELARQSGPHGARGQAQRPTTTIVPSVGPTLIGRRVELARLRRLLQDDATRVVTISGAGGVGKSVLTRAALSEHASAFGDGAHWIPLSDLQTVEQVAPRCIVVLGIEPRGAESTQQQLITRLRDRRMLLVFDNAEHLAGFGPWLDTLLAACDRLKVLVTSRERLGIASEWLLALEGLPVPDVDEAETEALRAFDAVRLFERCASRGHPDFDARGQAAEVAALVRAVDGLPLAIELAAAWVRLMPVAEIRRELQRSLDLLAGRESQGGRTVSVRESCEHTWRLLAPAEQRALVVLAVFPGDFSRESAQSVADAALPVLAALVDKSLLRTVEGGRFALHPLIRQFALEKLAQPGLAEETAAHARHAEYFLALLARYNEFDSVDQRTALLEIGAELENIIAAWRWSVEQHRVDLLQRCAAAMEGYLDARGLQQLGLELFNLAATAVDPARPEQQRVRCEIELGRAAFCFRRGEFGAGEAAARAALQAAQRARYAFGVKTSTNTLGLMLWRRGKMKEAAFCLRDVLRRSRADRDPVGTALYAGNLAAVERELGNYEEADRLLREALEGHRRLGHQAGVQSVLGEMVHLHLDRGRPEAAVPLANEALALSESSGFRRNLPYAHRSLADAYFQLNDLRSARKHVQSALEAIRAGGDRTIEPACRVQLAGIEMREGNRATALAQLQAAARLVIEMQSPRVQIAVVIAYARYCLLEARVEQARALFSLGATHPAALRRQREGATQALAGLAVSPAGLTPTPAGDPTLEQALDRLLAEKP